MNRVPFFCRRGRRQVRRHRTNVCVISSCKRHELICELTLVLRPLQDSQATRVRLPRFDMFKTG
jgi:hypothetical protein